jgi:hypothetical protein
MTNTLTHDHGNGNKTTYNLIQDGDNLPIAYNIDTLEGVVKVLETVRKNKTRIKIYLGDKNTGRDWGEECDTVGYVGTV